MVKTEEIKSLILAFEGIEQKPHFERIAFAVKKKIFATLSDKEQTLNVRLTPGLQFIFCPPGSDVIFPIDNAWGKQGWTTINLKKANRKMIQATVKEAYEERKKK